MEHKTADFGRLVGVTFNAKWHDLLAVYGTIRDRHEKAAARLIVR